ncbi:MAG: hypothetical protein ABSC55_10530 [Syntrophorhabdales bacterium]
MRAMGNLLWFILGGVRMGLAWSSAGLPEGIPWGKGPERLYGDPALCP